jgi:peptide deformylase
MEVLTLGNETLRQKTLRIENIDKDYESLALSMIGALREKKGVGLAGPQVGVLEKIFVVQLEGEAPIVFINPSIIETSPEKSSYEEGCLSLPGVWADVIRPARIKVQAWNEIGRPFTLEADGLLARVILHESDHLEGVLFIDHLSEVKRAQLVAKYEKIKLKGAASGTKEKKRR